MTKVATCALLLLGNEAERNVYYSLKLKKNLIRYENVWCQVENKQNLKSFNVPIENIVPIKESIELYGKEGKAKDEDVEIIKTRIRANSKSLECLKEFLKTNRDVLPWMRRLNVDLSNNNKNLNSNLRGIYNSHIRNDDFYKKQFELYRISYK